MKKIPSWIWIIGLVALLINPFIGCIIACILTYYLYSHGYFRANTVQKKPGSIPNTGRMRKPAHISGQKTPPEFIRKIEFLSNREIRFTNFTSARYMEENGSHQLMDVKNPRKANIYIRLNTNQFDVFIDCEESREQLSFESINLKALDITNHYVSMIEGNADDSYLRINYDNQYFTPLELEALMDFFKDFDIHNKTTKFQEQPIYENVTPPKQKKKVGFKFIGIAVIVILCICVMMPIISEGFIEKQEMYQTTILGPRTNEKYLEGLTYKVNNEINEDGWGNQCEYKMSNKEVPIVTILNKTGDEDYTKIYTYEASTFDTLMSELDFYPYRYDTEKKQHDFVNLKNGKWYHLSGVLDKDDYYSNDTGKDMFVDIYVMPTKKSLVQVTMVRTMDDINDYDINDFLSTFNFDDLSK